MNAGFMKFIPQIQRNRGSGGKKKKKTKKKKTKEKKKHLTTFYGYRLQ